MRAHALTASSPRHLLLVALSLLALAPAVPLAQVLPPTPDETGARVRVGPLFMNPTLSLSDVGMDTNLFNDAQAERPKRDLAFALVPQTDVWMRLGRTWATGTVRQNLVWFREYRDQRASNGDYRAGWVVPLTRLSVFVNGSWVRAKERPSFEIDTRANREEGAVHLAAEYRLWSRTLVGARAERRSIRFGGDSFFERQDLHEQLSRTRTLGVLTLRRELTPLTSLTAEVSRSRDRFVVSPTRDAASLQGSVGLRFDPAGIIRGSAQVGYRQFTPVSDEIPAFTGTTASASLSFVTPSASVVTAEVARDLEYSVEDRQPYYVLSGIGVSAVQRVFGPLEVLGRVGYRTLSYRNSAVGVNTFAAVRRDRVVIIGGGPSYRLGPRVRTSLDIERHERTSPIVDRRYRGFRYGVTLTYGL